MTHTHFLNRGLSGYEVHWMEQCEKEPTEVAMLTRAERGIVRNCAASSAPVADISDLRYFVSLTGDTR